MAGTMEPVSSTVVDKVESAAVSAHQEGVAQGMDPELARCSLTPVVAGPHSHAAVCEC